VTAHILSIFFSSSLSFHECLLGKLSQITRVLVTHQLQYLPFVGRIYVMHDGTIQASGTYQQVCIFLCIYLGVKQMPRPCN
jgi:ABC-type transport system involved in cytochrome bd biosynthesis fused ATPase/permease subunit